MGKSAEKFLYLHFVNEEKIASIRSLKERQKFRGRTFLIIVFTMVPAVLATLIGFDFTHSFSLIMFCIMVFFELLALIVLIMLFNLDLKYNVFRNKLYFWIFYLGFFLIGICGCISAGFNTTFIGNNDGSFRVIFNPVYFFFVIFPVYIGYIVFCYYAFIKCFAKYAH